MSKLILFSVLVLPTEFVSAFSENVMLENIKGEIDFSPEPFGKRVTTWNENYSQNNPTLAVMIIYDVFICNIMFKLVS